MAIDRTGISSLETGAPDITYTGDEGPKSPEQELMAQVDPMLVEEYQKYVFEMEEQGLQPMPFKQFIQQIMSESRMAQDGGGIQMASAADPMLEEEYQKYVFEMEEQGLQPMSFEEFRRQAVAGMATGGRAGYIHGGVAHPDGRRGFFKGAQAEAEKEGKAMSPGTSASGERRGPSGPPGGGDPGMTYTAPVTTGGPPGGGDPKMFYNPDYDEDPGTKVTTIPEEKSLYDKFRDRSYQFGINRHFVNALKKMGAFGKPGFRGFANELISGMGPVPEWAEDMSEEEIVSALTTGPYLSQQTSKGAVNAFAEGKDELSRVFEAKDMLSKGEMNQEEYNKLFPNPTLNPTGGGDGPEPIIYPYQTASATGTNTPVDPVTGFPVDPIRFSDGMSPVHDFTGIYGQREIPMAADGGRIGYAGGGIADVRQGYFLGKLVKKAGRALKKVIKSPIGKAALMYGLGSIGGSYGLTGKLFSKGMLNPSTMMRGLIGAKGAAGTPGIGGVEGLLGKFGLTKGYGGMMPTALGGIAGLSALGGLYTGMTNKEDEEDDLMKEWLAKKKYYDNYFAPVGNPANFERMRLYADGGRTGYDNGGSASDRYEVKIKELMDKGLSRELAEALVLSELSPDAYKVLDKKDGGRIGYAEGGNDDEEDHRSAALTAMYRKGAQEGGIMMASAPDPMDERNQVMEMIARDTFGKPLKDLTEDEIIQIEIMLEEMSKKPMPQPDRMMAQEGGLMDLGGMEKDYRNEGGFVPIGGQERADDVPARLSKNEFVFTADAVRNAGGGDIDKGAEIMENLMENLEKGGKVSEDSQGLEGARDMFATSQRLEGVL